MQDVQKLERVDVSHGQKASVRTGPCRPGAPDPSNVNLNSQDSDMHQAISVQVAAAVSLSPNWKKLSVAVLAATSLAAHADWQVIKTDRGAQLQVRSIASERMSELRVEVPTKATSQQLSTYLLGRYLDEAGEGIERKFVSRSATHAEWTDQIKAPMVSMRCATTRMEITAAQAPSVTSINFESVDRWPIGKPQDCVPLRTRGIWELVAAASGPILRYTVFTDLGGSVPTFMVRGALETDAIQRAIRVAQEASQ